MAFITTNDNVKLYYEIHGTGSPTLLFIHGFMDNGNGFSNISGALQDDYCVVVYDHRAHGKSETPENGYTITQLAKDMKCLIDTLGLRHVIPIGYSMGVHVIYRYIELYGTADFEKIILSVMSPKLINDESYHLGLYGKTTSQDALDLIVIANHSLEDYVLRDLREDMSEERKKQIQESAKRVATTFKQGPMVRLLLAMMEHDFWPTLEAITCPTLVIAGENDIYPLATHKEVNRRISGSKLVIIKECGHMMMYERPEEYIQELQSFITEDSSCHGLGKNDD